MRLQFRHRDFIRINPREPQFNESIILWNKTLEYSETSEESDEIGKIERVWIVRFQKDFRLDFLFIIFRFTWSSKPERISTEEFEELRGKHE